MRSTMVSSTATSRVHQGDVRCSGDELDIPAGCATHFDRRRCADLEQPKPAPARSRGARRSRSAIEGSSGGGMAGFSGVEYVA